MGVKKCLTATTVLLTALTTLLAIAFVMPFIMLLLGRFVLEEEVGIRRLAACGRTRGDSYRSCCGYAPLVFEHLDEFNDFHDRLRAQFLEQVFV